jgi:hypothetical protein
MSALISCCFAVVLAIPLCPSVETPKTWSDVANNPRFSRNWRDFAVRQIFHNDVRMCMNLSELATILKGAAWLSDWDTEIVWNENWRSRNWWAADTPPVELKDTVATLSRKSSNDGGDVIYLRISADMTAWQLRQVPRGRGPKSLEKATILQVGFHASFVF